MLGVVLLVPPSMAHLASYLDASKRGWSSETATVDPQASASEVADAEADPDAFVTALNHPTRLDLPVVLPDGSTVPRLPGVRRWMWDGEYCGSISVRYQPGSTDQPGNMELPPHCLGHIGYAVVPWKRRRGYATSALAQMLPIAREAGLAWVDLVTDTGNEASAVVVRANGGVLVRQYRVPEESGGFDAYQWRITL